MGIAIQTFYDDDDVNQSKEARAARLQEFPKNWVPFAETIVEDFQAAGSFVRALSQGVQTLDHAEMPAAEKAFWKSAERYLDNRPF